MKSLNVKALALSLGFTWAIGMLFLGWVAIFGWGIEIVDVLSSFYLGFEASFIGGIIGAIWGFVDGVITGLLIGYFYGLFEKQKEIKKKIQKVLAPKARKKR